jgi:hypothetical protein
MVYELRCYTLAPGKMPEYLKAAETIGRPARGQNYGVSGNTTATRSAPGCAVS